MIDAAEMFRVFIRANSPAGRALRAAEQRDRDELAEKWADEAAAAAVEGNPQRAGYIEHMARRVLG